MQQKARKKKNENFKNWLHLRNFYVYSTNGHSNIIENCSLKASEDRSHIDTRSEFIRNDGNIEKRERKCNCWLLELVAVESFECFLLESIMHDTKRSNENLYL